MPRNPKRPTKAILKLGQEFTTNTPESRKSGLMKKIVRDENARENITQYGVSPRVDRAFRAVGKHYKKKKK